MNLIDIVIKTTDKSTAGLEKTAGQMKRVGGEAQGVGEKMSALAAKAGAVAAAFTAGWSIGSAVASKMIGLWEKLDGTTDRYNKRLKESEDRYTALTVAIKAAEEASKARQKAMDGENDLAELNLQLKEAMTGEATTPAQAEKKKNDEAQKGIELLRTELDLGANRLAQLEKQKADTKEAVELGKKRITGNPMSLSEGTLDIVKKKLAVDEKMLKTQSDEIDKMTSGLATQAQSLNIAIQKKQVMDDILGVMTAEEKAAKEWEDFDKKRLAALDDMDAKTTDQKRLEEDAAKSKEEQVKKMTALIEAQKKYLAGMDVEIAKLKEAAAVPAPAAAGGIQPDGSFKPFNRKLGETGAGAARGIQENAWGDKGVGAGGKALQPNAYDDALRRVGGGFGDKYKFKRDREWEKGADHKLTKAEQAQKDLFDLQKQEEQNRKTLFKNIQTLADMMAKPTV